MAMGKCRQCGEIRELEDDEFDLEYPICVVCSSLLQAEVDADSARVEALLDEAGPVDTEVGPSLDLLNLPTSRDLWLKQIDYSREDHDWAMRNRRR